MIWATGDAALSRIGAINWETRQYMVEETADFLPQITPVHRRTVIGDAEQLAATSIVIAWSQPTHLLILGTDNRNVLAWTRKGYAKKGAALVLNQETSKRIARTGAQVEGVYIRSGRNFSPDWMTRTTYEEIERWANQYGFNRIRLKPIWGEMMRGRNGRIIREVEMPRNRNDDRAEKQLVFAEWNSGGGCFTEAAHHFGINAQVLQPRHHLAINQFYERYSYAPYVGGEVHILGRSAKTEVEVANFYLECKRLQPETALSMAPLGIEVSAREREFAQMVGSALFGDILGSIWQIAIWNRGKWNRPRMFDGPETTQYTKTL